MTGHKWLAWCPSQGETESTASLRIPDALERFSDAAEYFAQYLAGFDGDPFDELDVRVLRTIGEERILGDITVTVRCEPHFSAGGLRDVKQ